MRPTFLLILLTLIVSSGVVACGTSPTPPPLAVTDTVTLVFIYTDP